MKIVKEMAAQGDLLIRRINKIPKAAVKTSADSNLKAFVVAHSETGHHHVIAENQVEVYQDPKDAMVSYISVFGPKADLKHMREYDTHETLRLPVGSYELRRQREWSPEGWRRVED